MNDWRMLKLGDILKIKSGHDQKTIECKNGKYQILGTGGEIGRTDTFLYNKPSVLIGRKGTINKPMYKDEPFWTVDTLFYTEIKDGFSPKYVYYLFNTINWLRYNEASGVPSLTSSTIEKIKVKVPDLETQQKIVQILETWDNSINELELLTKNEKAKQKWLIHRLICDNKNAKIEKLCNLAKITTGKKDVNQGSSNGKYPFFTCAKEHTWSDDYSFNGEAICIAGNGEIGKSFYYNGKFEAYQRTYVLTNFTVSGQYLDYVIKSLFKEMVEHQKQMSAMPYIKLETLRNFVVPIPSNQEIYKIVKILSDEEMIINYYEKILDKTKSQKQYLLNHLISGDFDLTNIKLEKGKEQQ